ncbi:MAG TPA: N-acetylmuramoyl-L-alanine amidase [Candidatus Binatia bacterium]
MNKRALLPVIGFLALGVLSVPQEGCAGRPASYRLAQVEKRDPSRDQGAKSFDSQTPENNPSDGAQAPGLPDRARLFSVHFTSSNSSSRITIALSHKVQYETRRLPEDPSRKLPARLYIDLFNTKLAMASKDPITIEDGLLRQVRVGQFSADLVRVVIDMMSPGEHKAILLSDPYRLVIDFQAKKTGPAIATLDKGHKKTPAPQAKAQSPAIRKIVLDPGHGGKDPGAVGVDGIAEKDIVLAVAKKLAHKLTQEMGVQVILTRSDDRFIALEDRTAIANAQEADLFVSLHMNASPNGEARGLETYYLDKTTDEASLRLAARENATSRKNVSDLQFILSDMTQNLKLEDSITLAHHIQHSLVDSMSKNIADVRDLGVKKALFYVLVGARMPSVLVEMFFITNKTEGRAMSQENYQDAVVDALYDGIVKYNQSMLAGRTL